MNFTEEEMAKAEADALRIYEEEIAPRRAAFMALVKLGIDLDGAIVEIIPRRDDANN